MAERDSIRDVMARLSEFNAGGATVPHPTQPTRGSAADAKVVAKLRAAVARLDEPITLKKGDIVRGKPGVAENYKNSHLPHIIQEVFDTPRYPTVSVTEASSNAGHNVFHGVMGKLDRDGEYHSYLCDFRYWEVIPTEEN